MSIFNQYLATVTKLPAALLTMCLIVGLSVSAHAQGFGFNGGAVPVPGIPGGINPAGRDAWGVAGPAIGAGSAAGLQSFGVPAPIAGWAGGRIGANAQSAYREQGIPNQAVRTMTGVSVRDIQARGILGGDNSEARKVAGFFGIH